MLQTQLRGSSRGERGPAPDIWRPVTVFDVDLARPAVDTALLPGPRFILVRLHTRVLGAVLAPGGDLGKGDHDEDAALGTARGESLRALLAQRFAAEIRRHVARWGCSADPGEPGGSACLTARDKVLATAPTASVVVATRDRPELLRICVESVLDQSHAALEVVVVDNAPSSDATARLIAEEPGWQGRVRYVREQTPGLGRAHNAALPHVRGDVVAITDDDVVVDRHWLASLLEAFVVHGAGCVTGPIVPLELRTREQSWVEQYGGFTRGYTDRVSSLEQPPADDRLFPFTAGRLGSGANMAFTRATLREIGGFDPSLGAGTPARGGDDLAAFARTVLAGARIAYTPDAVVRHRHHADYEALRRMAHGYGVGLGAYLTSLVLADPRLAGRMARRLPAGLVHMLGPGSPKNARIEEDYPRALVTAERLGLLEGPLRYVVSRVSSRRAAGPGSSVKEFARGLVAPVQEESR